MPSALIVDDDATFRLATADYLADQGYDVREAADCASALAALRETPPDVLLVDLVLPDDSGLSLVAALPPAATTRVLVVTGHPSVETAIAAVGTPVDEYLVKPVSLDDLRKALSAPSAPGGDGAASRRDVAEQVFVHGTSPLMTELEQRIARVAPMDATVFIHGESGTGKELVARAVHRQSGREGAFVAINCGAIAENLIASELFGHEKGAFTGADRRRPGIFERATGGTVFLDEITEMPPEQQVNLLRVLETGQLTRVGGTQELTVDARVIAASNRNPERAVAAGTLREDLYYRLMVYPLRVPPLRERPEDVAALARHFLDVQNTTYGTARELTDGALERLTAHGWPGNVRELKHTLQRMYINADGDLDEACVPEDLDGAPVWDRNSLELTVGTPIAEAERRLVLSTLAHFNGDKKRAAQTLGVSLKTIYNRLQAWGLKGDELDEAE